MSESSVPKLPGSAGFRILLEILFGAAGQWTVSEYFPSALPFLWFVVLLLTTIELLNTNQARRAAIYAYQKWGVRRRMLSYIVIFIMGGLLLSLYWWGTGKAIATLDERKRHEFELSPSPTAIPTPTATPRPKIYELFRPAAQKYKEELGDARLPYQEASAANPWFYQALHEKAWVIFGRPLGGFYKLSIRDSQWEFENDNPDHSATWANNPEELKKRFPQCVGPNLYPPFSGVAVQWVNNPERWKGIGCRVWHCTIKTTDSVFLQEFDGGRLVGPIKASVTEDDAQIIVIIDKNRTWHSDIFKKAIDCRDPEKYRDPNT